MAEHPVRGGNGQLPDGEVVPRASEEVHLPGPSYLPVTVAFGIALGLVGVVVSFALLAIGVIIASAAIVRWLRETREEIAELPLER